ncbi:DUF4038 domain-containing protein [Gammaproteobacteria bacterium]|nr:DUF4038 domain-containing protein [Gammaproteobacteria bacterium]
MYSLAGFQTNVTARLAYLLLALLAGLLGSCGDSSSLDAVELDPGQYRIDAEPLYTYQLFELVLGASLIKGNPYTQGAALSAEFTGIKGEAAGQTVRVHGFWDGVNTWRIRFSPAFSGSWRYMTHSEDALMNGLSGELTVTHAPADVKRENPLLGGFVKAKGAAWQLSDGSRFFPVGDSQWSLLEEYSLDEIKAWLDVLKARNLNTVHGTVWLAKYTRSGEAPFKKRDAKGDRLNLMYFRQLDEMIRYANSKGIIPGLAIGGFPDNSRWYKQFKNQAQHDRWFRYIIDRYSAFNVRWLLFGEINEVAPPWLESWQDASAYYAALVKQRDPYKHPLGSHHTRVDAVAAVNADVDYIEVQMTRNENQYRQLMDYRQWSKPLWVEEYWYAPRAYDNDIKIGIRNTHQNFISALAFPTMGGLMRAHSNHPDFVPDQAHSHAMSLQDYLLEYDVGLKRLSEFKAFYNKLALEEFEPWPQGCDRRFCARFGTDYVFFMVDGGEIEIDLSEVSGEFSAHGLDVHAGNVIDYGRLEAGDKRRIHTGLLRDTALILRRE